MLFDYFKASRLAVAIEYEEDYDKVAHGTVETLFWFPLH